MSKLRGCDPFEQLWERRTTIQDENANAVYEVLAIEDLVRAKKTQRDKDWPMIRRLVEAHYDENQDDSNEAMVQFWFRESRTPSMLSEIIHLFPDKLASYATTRPWLVSIDANDVKQIEAFRLFTSRIGQDWRRKEVQRNIAATRYLMMKELND